jgi:cytosine/adenosine deaminase-related metal-dependent hydrolase
MNPPRLLIQAAMVVDGETVKAAPGAVLIEGDRILASGTPQAIGPVSDCPVRRLDKAVVIPGLVNVHGHLDLTHIGSVRYSGDFTQWIDLVRRGRAESDEGIAAAVEAGVNLARAGGTAIIGDIAGARSLRPIATLRRCGLAGVSFFEVFGLGQRTADAVAAMNDAVCQCPSLEGGVALGVQPHAPYSCDAEVYVAALRHKLPLATHLAESLDELAFVNGATGPIADFIKRIGVWDSTISGAATHPVDHLAKMLSQAPFVAAHLNYVEDRHLEMLSKFPITVAYCPRASAYFGHPQTGWPGHRYRDMLDAGINVALGTDSMLCLDTPDRLSVLDEMRLLYQRDGTDPTTLLRMGTFNGAIGLDFDPALVRLSPGPTAGLLAVPIDGANRGDPLRQILSNRSAPQWIVGPLPGRNTWRVARRAS